MHIDLHRVDPDPNGMVVRSIGGIKSLSMWIGDTELIATINDLQAKKVAQVLSDRDGLVQVIGSVRSFTIPTISL